MPAIDEALRTSALMKLKRTELVAAYRSTAAICHVIESLHERSDWPDVPVPNRTEYCIDLTWNFRLHNIKRAAAGHTGPRKSVRNQGGKADAKGVAKAEVRGHTEICYYCAQMQPPVRGGHTFMECLKRRRAGVVEYKEKVTPGAQCSLSACFSMHCVHTLTAPSHSRDRHSSAYSRT